MTEERDAKRFERLVLPHVDAAYNLARWLARNDEDAKDVTQEAYLRAFKFFDGFRGDDARAWMLTILRNTYCTRVKTHRPNGPVESFDKDLHILGEAGRAFCGALAGVHPETGLMRRATREILTTALEGLPRESREIIVLRELEELSYREIADIVDVPMGTVMSRLSRARRQLRQRLESMNGEMQC